VLVAMIVVLVAVSIVLVAVPIVLVVGKNDRHGKEALGSVKRTVLILCMGHGRHGG
jgi:hypothetical protein